MKLCVHDNTFIGPHPDLADFEKCVLRPSQCIKFITIYLLCCEYDVQRKRIPWNLSLDSFAFTRICTINNPAVRCLSFFVLQPFNSRGSDMERLVKNRRSFFRRQSLTFNDEQ